jgi:hypothetical protein
MKKYLIFLIPGLMFIQGAIASNYYVSASSGSDSNNGLYQLYSI